MVALAWVLLVGALTAGLVAQVLFIVAAWRVSVWWLLGVLCLWPVKLLFLVFHWHEAKKAFFVELSMYALLAMILVIAPRRDPAEPVSTSFRQRTGASLFRALGLSRSLSSRDARSEALPQGAPATTPGAPPIREVRAPEAEAKSPPRYFVDSEPAGATVSIDGREVGQTPWGGDGRPGHAVTVTLNLKGYQPWTRDVAPDTDLTITVPLKRKR